MKKVFTLWMILAGCVLGISACGIVEGTEDGAAGSETVREITLDNADTAGKESDASAQPSPEKASSGSDGKSRQKIISHAKVKSFGGTVMVGGSAYELYNYVDSSAKSYASVVNAVAAGLKGKAKVYDMVVPTSMGITFPDNKEKKVNSSNQKESIDSIYKKMHRQVTTIPLYDALMQHRKEYIYFRTDHHWTSRGAYYAYQAFCKAKGLQAHALSEYETAGFGGFLGSFYLDTNHSKALKKDHIRAYYPLADKKTTMVYQDENGGKHKTSLIANGKSYSTQLKYCAFLSGDNPYSYIHNKSIHDGSACVVIKESYGNTFIPYLADHYEKIYVVDYRYWKGSVISLARKKQAEDVIFINNISMTRNAYLIGKLAQVK